MIKYIVTFSIIIVLFGLIGFNYLGVREFPSVDPPVITVRTSYTGANADVVNADGQPPAVFPATEEIAVGACFERVFPANSLTILRLH